MSPDDRRSLAATEAVDVILKHVDDPIEMLQVLVLMVGGYAHIYGKNPGDIDILLDYIHELSGKAAKDLVLHDERGAS